MEFALGAAGVLRYRMARHQHICALGEFGHHVFLIVEIAGDDHAHTLGIDAPGQGRDHGMIHRYGGQFEIVGTELCPATLAGGRYVAHPHPIAA